MPNQTKSKNDNSKGIKKASTTPKKEKSTKDTKVSKASKASKTSKVKDNLQDSVESIISEPKETTICKKDKNVQKDKKIKAEDTKDEELTKDDYYTIIDSIIKQNNNKEFINHQLSSYKQFIVKDIGDIIKQFNTRKIYFNYDQKANKHKTELHIDFLNYNIGGPTIHENDGSYQQMTPQMARLRNLTYRAPLNINLKLTRIVRSRNENKSAYNLDIEDVKERYFNNIKFGQIPIMVRSHNCILNKKDGLNNVQKGECKYDYGGYFIISGNEKVIVSQERMAEGEPFVFSNQRKQKCIEIEIRCVSDDHFSVVMNNLIRLKYDNNSLEFESPSFKHPIPIFLLFKAMDIKNDKDMIQTIIWELGSGTKNETKFLKIIKDGFIAFNNNPTFKLGNDTRKYQELVITYLNFKGGNKEIKLTMDDKIAYLKKIFIDEVLPHVGSSFSKKCKYMGMMIRKLLLVHLGELPFDDRDSYQNKRVDTPGRLLASLFRQCFNKLVKDIVKNLTKEIKNNKGSKDIFEIITNDNMYRIVKPNIIEGGLKYALATGNWGVKTNGKGSAKVGTAQVLNRLNYQSYLSHLRRINSPNDKKNNNGKIIKPRKLHGTVWGYICPIETPEGQPVGLVKNMAMSTKISYSCNSTLVKEMITKLGMISINKSKYSDYYKHTLVLVNGNWIGIHKEPEKFIKELREARRNGLINIYTGIYWDYTSNQIKIYTDAGRLLRPLFIVRDDAINLTKQDIRHLKMLNNNFNYLLTPNNFLHELKINSLFKNINHGISLNEGDNKKIMSQINENIEELKILKENGNNFNSIIEYIDTNETNNCLISISPDELKNKNLDPKYVEIAQYNNGFTHCEIDPSIIQGVVASVIPFPDRNQSPRNTYQCLKYDTLVLMGDCEWKKICDIKVGDEVLSFNPEGAPALIHGHPITTTKVINQYVRPTDKKIYEISISEYGRLKTITATEDHKFMSSKGWIEVKDMIAGTTQLVTLEGNQTAIEYPEPDEWEVYYRDNNYPEELDNQFLMKHETHSDIVSIKEVENCMIADITTESKNHSFIANGFFVHNSAMCKQAMGVYITNFQERMDTVAYVLDTVERPLVRTRYGSTVNYSNLPCGLNAMVAICCYTGYNQEDSVLLNQNAVDRGLFRATFYRTYKDDEKKIQSNGKEEKFGKPDPKYTQNMKPANYGKLNENGFAEKNEFVTSKDIIIGKVLPLKNKSENGHPLYKDCSTNLKPNESGFIDKIYTSRNADGFRFIKTKIRSIRIPSIGDKFSSRCGQKGTVGILYNQEDMPYSEEGLCPDIIMNSHAIPSRMTIGQIMECLMGKASADLGGFSDCTPFTDLTEEQVGNILLANGFDYTGNETLYSGITGQQMNVKIFMGPTYYQRLKHMVIDKIHSRDSGPVVQLTRQPAEGRSRDGGLRMGEMERDCFVYNTPVTLNSFSSIMIQDLEKQDKYVLGWDKKKNGMVKSKQTHFLCKGERKCVDLTFNDGRVVSCTPEHKVLTSENKWVKVKDLKVGTDKVKTAIRYPLINIKNEMKLCKDWSLNAGSLKLNCKTEKDYLKSLAFARIIGYLTTDGHIKNDENSGSICLGHMIDVEGLIDDLKYFQKNLQKNYKVKNKNFYTVYLQTNFIKNVAKLKGIATGNKYDQDIELPEFILDKKCPLPIIREYLGGLFGGDGHTCVLGLHRGKRDTLTSISFSKSRMPKHLKSLEKTIKKLQYLLKKFGIKKTTIQKKKETSHSKNRHKNNELLTDESRSYQITLHLDIDELITFHEKIGFRYCCHKTQRLEAGVAYKRLRDAVVRQRLWIIKRVDELCNYTKIKEQNPNQVIKTKKYVDKAIEELEKKEALIHKYAIPTKHAIGDYLIKKRSVDKFNYKSFPTAEKFMRDIGAYNWFINDEETDDKTDNKTKTQEKIKEETEEKTKDDTKEETKEETKIETKDKKEDKNKKSSTCYGVCRDAKALPTMNLTLIDRRDGGTHKVYDIQVEDTHSFAANGIVSHNCMIAHGALGFLKERLMDVSDLFSINICRSCGSIAVVNDDEDNEIYECRMCDKYVDFATIDMPYACKLLMQELQGMMVTPKFILN